MEKNLLRIVLHQDQSVFVSVFLIDYRENLDLSRSIKSIVCVGCVLAKKLPRAELILKQYNAMNHPTSLKR